MPEFMYSCSLFGHLARQIEAHSPTVYVTQGTTRLRSRRQIPPLLWRLRLIQCVRLTGRYLYDAGEDLRACTLVNSSDKALLLIFH